MRVLILAPTATRARAVVAQTAFLLERRVDVLLVTADPAVWSDRGLDHRVTVHRLERRLSDQLLARLEDLVVFRLPRRLFAAAQAVIGAERVLRGVERRYLRAAETFHRSVFLRAFPSLLPYLQRHQLRRAVVPALDLDSVDQVVVGDADGVPLAWHLARSRPDLGMTYSVDRAAFGAPEPLDAADV